MLQITDIRKQYVTGELVQTALDGVSLTLRDNEFVAILGPSGSGKTTLLNVIGGLDRYDSGDLIINGISTKKYTDRDWDSYRNHTIGFVFQSYNLIPHQTVLANVELALTISGISPSERKRRAKEALEAVGLGNQLHKKPNQMSGGQMQRVAIARALVNNPDILLADEPTGALDTQTSVQIMDLLKEVARDRLVVMVTHNPELAEEYATRIVRVKDGKIIGDTDPYEPDTQEPAHHENMGRSSMRFWTALTLSFNNLWTKKARTLLTAFAGSIGIIGIALIMSLSTGFQLYIDKIQEDTLSNYPLSIGQEKTDISAIYSALGSAHQQAEELETRDTVVEQQMISQMFGNVGKNDLGAFKSHLEKNYDQVAHALNAVKYSYGIKPLIFSSDLSGGPFQVNPANLFGELTGSSAMSSYMDSDIFYEMMDNTQVLEAQYDVIRGRWPQDYTEMILVLQNPHRISDYTAYALGMRDSEELEELMSQVMSGEPVEPQDTTPMSWTYDELLALEFKLVAASDRYRYNPEYSVWEDMSDDDSYMENLVSQGDTLKIVGIVAPKEGVSSTALSSGIAYTADLTRLVMSRAGESKIVQDQLADSKVDVFTGTPFGQEAEEKGLNFEEMITVDGDLLSSAFGMNIDQDALIWAVESYLSGISVDVDTAPAQAAFIDGLTIMGKGMLNSYISANADETGTATLALCDVQSIVENYLAGNEAASVLTAITDNYDVTEDVLRKVYSPLLNGLISWYIADDMGADANIVTGVSHEGNGPLILTPLTSTEEPEYTFPEFTLPEELPEWTLPEELPTPEEIIEAVVPEEILDALRPSDSTEPTVPETTVPETTVPETTVPETTVPETTVPETTVPETTVPETTVPETTVPETTVPETTVPETTVPETTVPETTVPETTIPETTEPEPSIPQPTEPEPTIPEPTFPEITIDPATFSAPITLADVDGVVSQYSSSAVVTGVAGAMAGKMMESEVYNQIMYQLSGLGNMLMNKMGNAFYVDESKFAEAFQFNMDEEELQRLMTAMQNPSQAASYDGNLRKLGYADESTPTGISLYFVDFATKEDFIAFLDGYNEDMEAAGKEDQIIGYADVTGIMMSSVRTIIDSVSYALIAFVAVSLVVSSIMIGIITYISVMERTKEIGVLRAIGASKRNISQVFNAETFIIGLCSGLIGVGVSLLLLIPGNALIHHLTNNPDIVAQLPVTNAVVLILLSMILTLIGGFIPAKQAAKKDPVIALRSE